MSVWINCSQWLDAGEGNDLVADQASEIFKKRCVSCHAQSQPRGGLDMSSLDSIRAGSNSGKVVEAGDPEASLVYLLAAHLETPKMPPNAARLPQRELDTIAAWIKSLEIDGVAVGEAVPMNAALEVPLPEAKVDTSRRRLIEGLVAVRPMSGPLAITAMASSGSLLAVSGHKQVLLVDIESGTWLGALDFPEGDVFALKFTADGTRLIGGGGKGALSGSIVCWDVATWNRVLSVPLDDDVVMAMDVSPDGKLVAIGGPTRVIEVIELLTGTRRHVLRKHADWVTSLAFSLDGHLLASGDRFGSIYVWDVQAGSLFESAENHAGTVESLVWSQDSNELWSAGRDGFVQQWSLPEACQLNRWQASESPILDMQVVDSQLITIHQSKAVYGFSFMGLPTKSFTISCEPTVCATVSRWPLQVIIGSLDGQLLFFDISKIELSKSMNLLEERRTVELARRTTKPVERQVRNGPAETENRPLNKISAQQDALKLIRQSLKSSKINLEQLQRKMAELESQIDELQQLVDQLEP